MKRNYLKTDDVDTPHNLTISKVCQEAYATSEGKGWHQADVEYQHITQGKMRLIMSWLAKLASEVGKAIEAIYINDMDALAAKLANVIIRTCDISAHLDIDLATAVASKLEFNKHRPVKRPGDKQMDGKP